MDTSNSKPTDLGGLRAWMTSLSDTVRCSADPDVAENPRTFVLAENGREEQDAITIGDVLALLDVADAAIAWETDHATDDFRERCRDLRAAVHRLRRSGFAKVRAWMVALRNTVRAYTSTSNPPQAYVIVENYHGDTITLGDMLALLGVADAAIAWEIGHVDDDFRERCRDLRAAVHRLQGGPPC